MYCEEWGKSCKTFCMAPIVLELDAFSTSILSA